MPQNKNTKKATGRPAVRQAQTKAKSSKTQQAWLRKLKGNRFAKPLVFIAAFMVIGVGLQIWASAATTTYSLWSTSAVPRVLSVNQSSGREVGVKFKSSVAGYVTGVRFYKSAQNTGQHTGSLWTSNGTLLATVVFSQETASGWQYATFLQPVSIAANVTYVVSYHAPNGHFSKNGNYFRKSHGNNKLTALQNTASTPNGVFVDSPIDHTFPTQSGNGDNYWVDLTFKTKLLSPSPAPAAPTGITATAQSSTSVALSWTASISANTITGYNIYRNGNKLASVSPVLTYIDSSVTAGNTYSYQVQAIDSTGATSALSTAASATTPPGGTSGGGGGTTSPSTCALPQYPSASCTGVPSGTSLTVVNGNQAYGTSYNGQTISNKDFHGFVVVTGSNITFKNCIFRGSATSGNAALLDLQQGGTGNAVENSEFAPSAPSAGIDDIWAQDSMISTSNIHGGVDGIKADSNSVIRDSYIHDLTYFSSDPNQGGGPTHNDTIQILSGNNIRLTHNTLQATKTDNSAVQITQHFGPVSNVYIDSNSADGGGCTFNASHIPLTSLSTIYITNNHFGRNSGYTNCPILISTKTVLSANAGNVWGDTGSPIPAPQQHD